MKNILDVKSIIIIIIIFIVLITLCNLYKNKLYDFIVSLYMRLKLFFDYGYNKYFYNNFTKIFPHIKNINNENFNNTDSINADKNSINQYKIVNMIDYKYLITNIINHKNVNESFYKILKSLITHVNINGKKIDIDRCVFVDVLYSNLQSFPALHTDNEWGVFDKSDGFQVWYLYENDENIGNMYLLETDYVLPSSFLVYNEDGTVTMYDQCGDKEIKTFSDKTKLKADIKYLKMKSGECLLFGKNLYHMSDYRKSKYRYSVNFRVIIKDPDGGIPINMTNKCPYNTLFINKIKNKKIKYANGKIYPNMFDLLYMI